MNEGMPPRSRMSCSAMHVELERGDSGLDRVADAIEHVGDQAPGNCHLLDLRGRFEHHAPVLEHRDQGTLQAVSTA